MIELRPLKDKKTHTELIQRVLQNFLYKYYFMPLMDVIKPIERYYSNDINEDIVTDALRTNRLQYVNGRFYGKLNARLTKALQAIGAKWNKRIKAFELPRQALNINMINAIAFASVQVMKMEQMINNFLSTFNIEQYMSNLKAILDDPLNKILDDYTNEARYLWGGKKRKINVPNTDTNAPKILDEIREEARANFLKNIGVEVNLTKDEKQALKDEYFENLSIPIQKFTQEQTNKLRALVAKSYFDGRSLDVLVKAIQKEFDVSATKARFWARNETGILRAKFVKNNALKHGITKYKWSTSKDNRVRDMHKHLQGQIFEFLNPPIVNNKGDRKNPGEDYQCRCIAIPIVE